MPYFAVIKLGSDALLVISLIFLCYRLLASGSMAGKTAQLMILEASLKGLIRDAEGAGRTLNDELERRQHALERLLQEFHGHEQRIAGMQEAALKQVHDLDLKAKGTQSLMNKITKAAAASSAVRRQAEPEDAPEPPSFQAAAQRAESERHKLPERKTSRLSDRIERAVEPAASSVSETAREVRKIADESAGEQHPETDTAQQARDPRLGVLGGMKRQVQTL